MHLMIAGCVLLVVVNLVKSEVCTLESFLNDRNMYDSNFDTDGMAESYRNQEEVRVNCTVGFAGFLQLFCLHGVWMARGPKCDQIKCEKNIFEFADIFRNAKSQYRFNEEIEYVCKNEQKGRFSMRCGENGWIGSPICRSASCQLPSLPPGLEVTGSPSLGGTVDPGHMLQFQCDGYRQLEGPRIVTCLSTGKWDATFPTCSEFCIIPEVPRNVISSSFPGGRVRKGENVFFHCLLLWHDIMQGNSTIECLANGEWSGPVPKCRAPGPCGPPPNLANGDIKTSFKSKYAHNEEVEYACQEYYVMEGNPSRTCNNGEWIGQNRCLEPCTVSEEDMNRNNIRIRYLLKGKIYSAHNDTISFVCKQGRPVAGVGMRQKCLEGEIQLPRCQ